MRQEYVGAQGVAPQDLARIGNELASAHRTLSVKSEGGLAAEFACLNLAHEMPGSLQAIQQAAAEMRNFQDILFYWFQPHSFGVNIR